MNRRRHRNGPEENAEKQHWKWEWLRRNREYRPPEHEIIMSMVGFEEAYEHSISVRVSSDPDLDIKLASLPGLAIMKLISWKEKYPDRKRDAEDLLLIINIRFYGRQRSTSQNAQMVAVGTTAKKVRPVGVL